MPPLLEADMSKLLERGASFAAERLNQLAARDISSTVLDGYDPTTVDPKHPITLFIIQLIIIIVFTQGLGWFLRYIKQPAVIAEVIGGILLGPTAFGRIPNFTRHIFPPASIPYLNLVANVGLVLFLFLIGVEVDIGVMKRNGRAAAFVSITGMIIPFGLGAAGAVPTYNNFVDKDVVSFGHFMLFVGVAMAITAFPVLCRILTSTKLLETRVGTIVLAAGVGNDVVGWVLLALTLALVNGGGGATAGYMLLASVGWTIILLWPIKKAFIWACKRTGSLDGKGPTIFIMNLTLVIVFISAFVTGILGVHPIFGAFIAGLIIPHEGGFAIYLVEKIDDLVALLFLPIYFVLSGLSTDLGLINDGKSWGYIILFCVIGWAGKFIGCAGTAKLLGYTTRESGAIGMLMSCKGLVELIVLNVGYQAGIIDQRLFSMFVLVAVFLTFITTPCTVWIYPAKYRVRGNTVPRPMFSKDRERRASSVGISGPGGRETTERFLMVLQKVEHLSAVMLISQMLEPSARTNTSANGDKAMAKAAAATVKGLGEGDVSDSSNRSSPSRVTSRVPSLSGGLRMDALKLIELTGRTFSVMQSAEKDQMLLSDDALQLFKQYGRLRGFEITPHLEIVGTDSYPSAVSDLAQQAGSELVIVPWTVPHAGADMLIDISPPAISGLPSSSGGPPASPVNSIFGPDAQTHHTHLYSDFVRRVFTDVPSDVALFIDRGFGATTNFVPGSGQHIFLPFFGGPDDRLALRFVVQLCANQSVSATIVRIELDLEQSEDIKEGVVFEADNVAWQYYAANPSNPRIAFHSLKAPTPLAAALENCELAAEEASKHQYWRPLIVVTGRGVREAPYDQSKAVGGIVTEKGRDANVATELRKTVGDVATAMILGGVKSSEASYLVLESGHGKAGRTL